MVQPTALGAFSLLPQEVRDQIWDEAGWVSSSRGEKANNLRFGRKPDTEDWYLVQTERLYTYDKKPSDDGDHDFRAYKALLLTSRAIRDEVQNRAFDTTTISLDWDFELNVFLRRYGDQIRIKIGKSTVDIEWLCKQTRHWAFERLVISTEYTDAGYRPKWNIRMEISPCKAHNAKHRFRWLHDPAAHRGPAEETKTFHRVAGMKSSSEEMMQWMLCTRQPGCLGPGDLDDVWSVFLLGVEEETMLRDHYAWLLWHGDDKMPRWRRGFGDPSRNRS